MSQKEGIFLRKRDMILVTMVMVGALVLCIRLLSSMALETGSWGIHFSQEGQPPTGNASAGSLKQYDAMYLKNTDDKVLYLTFDAGYENGCTEKILDVLKQHKVPAAFFLVGNYIKQNGDLVRRMAKEGHIVANHTMHHPDMSKITEETAFQKEVSDLEILYKDTTGLDMPKYYRPPQGLYSEDNLRMAKHLGYKTVFWSLAYVDWNQDSQPTKEYAFSKLLPRTHPGAVVLLHSTSQTNADILDELLTKWKDMGYRFGTLEELFER